MYDVVENTLTRRRSQIPCVIVEKNTTRRREDGGVIVEKIYNKVHEHLIKIFANYLQQ